MQQLTNSQRKFLKQQAHSLSPLVQIGKGGASPQVVQSLAQALAAHELVKIKFVALKNEKKAICLQLAENCDADLVTIIGHVAVFFRQHPDEARRTVRFPTQG